MICTIHVSNNRQLNTLITVHTEIEIDQKKPFTYCTHTVLLQRKVLLNREDLLEPPKKHFNLE